MKTFIAAMFLILPALAALTIVLFVLYHIGYVIVDATN